MKSTTCVAVGILMLMWNRYVTRQKQFSIACRMAPRVLMMVILLFSGTNCGLLDEGFEQFRLFREQSIFEIDNAAQQITSGIGSVTSVLENLNERLPAEIHKTLSFDVPFIIDAVAGEGISAGLCLVDATASKALYLLELMKSEIITGEPVPLPDPFICHTSVGAINLNQDINQRQVVEFTGYNLFLDRKFSAGLATTYGDTIPVPVGRPTQYRVATNISNFDDNILDKCKNLILFYDEKPISSLFIVKKQKKVPLTKLVNPRVIPGYIAAYPTVKPNEDIYFVYNSKVAVSITFGNDLYRAWVEMTMFIEEEKGPFSKPTLAIGKSKRSYYYTAPTGWHIKRITGQSVHDYHTYRDLSNEDDIRETLFGQLTIKAKGSQAGSTTSGVLNFGSNVPDIIIEENP